MKKIVLLFWLLICSTIQAQKVSNPTYEKMLAQYLKTETPSITVDQLSSKLKLDKTFYFFDARERKEFNTSHVKNAIFVGYDHFNIKEWEDFSRDKTIIVYCSVGIRSQVITKKLIQAGFTAQNLYGGIFEWVNQGNKVFDKTEKSTQKVHAYDKDWGKWLLRGEKVYE